MFIQLPDIPLRLRKAVGDCLCGIDSAAAAYGQEEVRSMFPSQPDPLVHLVKMGIGDDAANLGESDAFALQRLFDQRQQPGAPGAVPAIDQHDVFRAIFPDVPPCVSLLTPAKIYFGRCVILKIVGYLEVPPVFVVSIS